MNPGEVPAEPVIVYVVWRDVDLHLAFELPGPVHGVGREDHGFPTDQRIQGIRPVVQQDDRRIMPQPGLVVVDSVPLHHVGAGRLVRHDVRHRGIRPGPMPPAVVLRPTGHADVVLAVHAIPDHLAAPVAPEGILYAVVRIARPHALRAPQIRTQLLVDRHGPDQIAEGRATNGFHPRCGDRRLRPGIAAVVDRHHCIAVVDALDRQQVLEPPAGYMGRDAGHVAAIGITAEHLVERHVVPTSPGQLHRPVLADGCQAPRGLGRDCVELASLNDR